MAVLDFLRKQVIVKNYLLTTIFILSLTMVVNFFGFTGNPSLQALAGSMSIVGVLLMVGMVLMTLTFANRNTSVGRILIRFSYVTLTVAGLCMSVIAITTIISSFLAGFGTMLAVQMSSTAFATQMALSVVLATLGYYTLSLEGVWALNHPR